MEKASTNPPFQVQGGLTNLNGNDTSNGGDNFLTNLFQTHLTVPPDHQQALTPNRVTGSRKRSLIQESSILEKRLKADSDSLELIIENFLLQFQEALTSNPLNAAEKEGIFNASEKEILVEEDYFSFDTLPEELLLNIMTFLEKSDLQSLSTVSTFFRKKIYSYFEPNSYDSKRFKSQKILRASKNYESNHFTLKTFPLNQFEEGQENNLNIHNLTWIKGKAVLHIVNTSSHLEKFVIFHKDSFSLIDLPTSLSIKDFNHNLIILTAKEKQFIYDFSTKKVLDIFDGQLFVLSEKQFLILEKKCDFGNSLSLVTVEPPGLMVRKSQNSWNGTIQECRALSEDRILVSFEGDQPMNIYDFSLDLIYPLPYSIFTSTPDKKEEEIKIAGPKLIEVINSKEIVVHIRSIPKIFKLLIPEGLNQDPIVEENDLQKFLNGHRITISDKLFPIKSMKFDQNRDCILFSYFAKPRGSPHNANCVLIIDLKQFSSKVNEFGLWIPSMKKKLTRVQERKLTDEKLHIVGNKILRTVSKRVEVWEIGSVHFENELPRLATVYGSTITNRKSKMKMISFNGDMTAFAFIKEGAIHIRDYSALPLKI